MKKTRIMALILCLAMLICTMSAFTVSAAAPASLNGEYTVDGNKLTLKLVLKNNPGINTLVAGLAYDGEALTIDTVTNGDVFSAANNGSMFDVNTANNPLILYFDENGVGNITANGTVVTIVFTVNQTKDDYGFILTVDNDNTFACGEGIVPVDVEFGPCTVSEKNFVVGDINGDGKINAIDGNLCRRVILGTDEFNPAADINGDGKVNAIDGNLIIGLILGN